MNGAPKPIMTGKKGSVGGISTPGRHGNHMAAMRAGVKNLIAPGPGTKKSVKSTTFMRPEGNQMPDKNAGAKKSGSMPMHASGSPSKAVQMGSKVTAAGHNGIHVGTNPEPSVKRDSASVAKPFKG